MTILTRHARARARAGKVDCKEFERGVSVRKQNAGHVFLSDYFGQKNRILFLFAFLFYQINYWVAYSRSSILLRRARHSACAC